MLSRPPALLRLCHAALVLAVAALVAACASSATTARHGAVGAKGSAATVVHADSVAKLLSPSGAGSVRVLARGDNAFVARLRLAANAKIPVHRDASEETIYVLEGSGTMTIDGREYTVRPGTAIFMPAGAEVSFVNGPSDLVALQVFADPTSASKYDSWRGIRRL